MSTGVLPRIETRTQFTTSQERFERSEEVDGTAKVKKYVPLIFEFIASSAAGYYLSKYLKLENQTAITVISGLSAYLLFSDFVGISDFTSESWSVKQKMLLMLMVLSDVCLVSILLLPYCLGGLRLIGGLWGGLLIFAAFFLANAGCCRMVGVLGGNNNTPLDKWLAYKPFIGSIGMVSGTVMGHFWHQSIGTAPACILAVKKSLELMLSLIRSCVENQQSESCLGYNRV
ncbi:MAG: hypothetical protein KDK71_01070 [Chlamydiia bacterium]|nr:hypothetical protein [Chlamydiia bacterium]